MTRKFSAICSGAKLSEAIEILSSRKISELPVVNHFDQPIGLIDITDLIGLEPLVGAMEPIAPSASIRIFGSTL
jgi:arabinose-5-phosphate isomerase